MDNRFVDIKKLQLLIVEKKKIEKKIDSYNTNHCRDCGDTEPKNNFYPLWGMAVGEGINQTSGLLCNKCALSDKEYLRIFNEVKET